MGRADSIPAVCLPQITASAPFTPNSKRTALAAALPRSHAPPWHGRAHPGLVHAHPGPIRAHPVPIRAHPGLIRAHTVLLCAHSVPIPGHSVPRHSQEQRLWLGGLLQTAKHILESSRSLSQPETAPSIRQPEGKAGWRAAPSDFLFPDSQMPFSFLPGNFPAQPQSHAGGQQLEKQEISKYWGFFLFPPKKTQGFPRIASITIGGQRSVKEE